MSISINKTVAESVSISDSAKSASIVTDSGGIVWDLSNRHIMSLHNTTPVSIVTDTNNVFQIGADFATVQAAFLATRS